MQKSYKILSLRGKEITLGKDIEEKYITLTESLETKYLKLSVDANGFAYQLIQVVFECKKDIEALYKNGFDYKNHHYIRYKRSASSVKEGKCFFIESKKAESISFSMWKNWNLSFEENENKEKIKKDFLAYQAYCGLMFSSCEDFFKLSLDNILIIEDKIEKSSFDNVYSVGTDSNIIKGPDIFKVGDVMLKGECIVIENNVFDGQGLLDKSVFDNICGGKYKNRSMLLLRNNFFKACAFNTNLSKWFADNGLKGEIERKNGFPCKIRGYTNAKKYEDIKLVVTYSSLKYIKFFEKGHAIKAIKKWFNNAFNEFGIVKTDTPSSLMEGNYVYTNYQLLNTIDLSENDIDILLTPTFNLLDSFYDKNDGSNYFTSYLALNTDCPSALDVSNIQYDSGYFIKSLAIRKLLDINSNFSNTVYYRDFIDNEVEGIINRARKGRILVKGNYAYLFANPYGYLRYILNIDDEGQDFLMAKGTIMCTGFEYGKNILGSRAPHVMMGNVYIAINEYYSEIDKYFNLSKYIVCINLSGENLAARLNGADEDGDQILLTDDELLIYNVKEYQYEKFRTPNNRFESGGNTNGFSIASLAKMENRIRKNNIGSIINLAQKYNSLFWDYYKEEKLINKIFSSDNVIEIPPNSEMAYIYFRLCILEVLSNTEIDAAKGKYDVDSRKILKEIKELDVEFDNRKEKVEKEPLFFKYATDDTFNPRKKGWIKLLDNTGSVSICGISKNNKCIKDGMYYPDENFKKKEKESIDLSIIKYKDSKGNIFYSGYEGNDGISISISDLRNVPVEDHNIYHVCGTIDKFLGDNKYTKYNCPMDYLEERIDKYLETMKATHNSKKGKLKDIVNGPFRCGGAEMKNANAILERLDEISKEINKCQDSEKREITSGLFAGFIKEYGNKFSLTNSKAILNILIKKSKLKSSDFFALFFILNNKECENLFIIKRSNLDQYKGKIREIMMNDFTAI